MAAQLICVAPLENPRLDGSFIYFDASIFSVQDGERPIIAGLRYFNSLNITFNSDGPNLCAIVVNVSNILILIEFNDI